MSKLRILLLPVAGSAFVIVSPAIAQNAATPIAATPDAATQTAAAPPPADDQGQLQEIIVTAQRTSQSLQDVPIAVSAVNAQSAQVRGLNSLTTLTASIPALDVHIQGQAPSIFLRGIGTDQGTPNVEPSVALYIDGVYFPNAVANIFSFNNIDRIEVLKGPQGTLFGRNATGGVIQIITKDPSHTTAMRASLGYGNYDTINANAYATAGLTDNLAADLAVTYENRGEGYGRNITTGQKIGKSHNFGARAKLLFTPGDRTEIRLTGDYTQSSSDLIYQQQPGVVAIDGQIGYGGKYVSRGNFRDFTSSKQYGGSLKIDHDLDFARLVSITAYHQAEGLFVTDQDQTPLPIVNATLNEPTHNFSQELQLLSAKSSKIQWATGVFYFRSNAAFAPAQIAGLAAAPLPYIDYNGRQKVESISVYAQATAPVMRDTNLTLGIRYTRDKVDFEGEADSSAGTIIPRETESFKSSKPTWRIALDHHFSDDINAYVSYNRGVKTGGYNIFVPTSKFDPEQLDAYEVGLKTELFDRHLRLNVAAFYYDYKNIQVTIVQNGLTQSANAAAAKIHGVDFDFQARITRRFNISGGGSYLKGHYSSYDNAIYFPASPLDPIPPIPANGATGNPTVYTPKWTGNLQADYTIPSPLGEFTLSGSLAYNDGSRSDPYGVARMPSYTLVNSSVNLAMTDNLGLNLWVRNLTDKYYMVARIASGFGNVQIPALPRTFGATVNVKF